MITFLLLIIALPLIPLGLYIVGTLFAYLVLIPTSWTIVTLFKGCAILLYPILKLTGIWDKYEKTN